MSLVRRNIVANAIGSGWTALLLLAFVPLYIHFMGVESYGLVGFFATLQVLFSVLDLGITGTLSRELARLSALGKAGTRHMRDVVRTLEILYWALAALIVAVVALTSEWVATVWLNTNQLPPEVVRMSIMLMGVAIAFRMPYGFYSGGLIGLQKQLLFNGMKIGVETFRNGGGVLVLWLVAPTITAFFIWHALASIIGAVLLRLVLLRSLPTAEAPARFAPALFGQLWRYGAGLSGIGILATLVVELDKIILSKMLPLEEFGYYMLASTLALGINLIIVPIFSAVQPRLTQLVASGDDAGLRRLYHKGCQLMSVIVLPVAFGLCFFSEPVLHIWTRDAAIAQFAAPLLSLLSIGTALNALLNVPYALQLAHGWIKLALISTAVAVVVLVPVLIWMIAHFGAIGAASIWVVLNGGNVLFSLPIVHAKFLRGEFRRWLVDDFARPALAALAIVGLGWFSMPSGLGMAGQAAWITVSVLGGLLGGALLTPLAQSLFPRRAT